MRADWDYKIRKGVAQSPRPNGVSLQLHCAGGTECGAEIEVTYEAPISSFS